MRGGILTAALLSLSMGSVPLARAPAAPPWHELEVPGGIARLAEAIGVPGPVDAVLAWRDITRRVHASTVDSDHVSALKALRAHFAEVGEAKAGPDAAVDTIPSPLSADAWAAVRGAPTTPAALLLDRRAVLLGYGLLSLDADTLSAVAAERALLGRLYRDRAAAVAAFGRGLRISGGRVQVPGGAAADAIWTDLAGVSPRDVPAFVERLFDRDGGRLAAFHDALAHLDGPHLAFALGGLDGEAADRVRRARLLYESFSSLVSAWQFDRMPFKGPPVSPALVLLEVAVSADGRPLFPARRAFWDAAFAGAGGASDANPLTGTASAAPDDLVTAPWLLGRLAAAEPLERADRLRQVLFAQRRFPTPDAAHVLDVLAAVRGVRRMPALVLTLERIGIADPALYAEALRAAEAVMATPGREPATAAMAQFQCAIAIVERLRWSRSLTVDAAGSLLHRLFAIPVGRDGFDGGVARWLDVLLTDTPSAASTAAADTGREQALLAGFAGQAREGPLVRWEDLSYRVDLGARELQRLARVRERQGGHSLDTVLALARAASALQNAASPADAAAAIAQMRAALDNTRTGSDAGRSRPVERSIAERLDALSGGGYPPHVDKLRRAGPALVALADLLLARVMTALVYAASLGAPDSAALLAGDVSSRHDFGSEPSGRSLAWTWPIEISRPPMPWHVRGSLLALDLGLGRFRLRRMVDGAMPPPALTDNERRALTDTVVLFNAREVTNADRSAIAAAIARGRARVQAIDRHDAAGLERLSHDSGLSEWRRQAFVWITSREAATRLSLFSLGELLWLGRPEPGLVERLARWGTGATLATGCLCLRLTAPLMPESFEGREDIGLIAAAVPDVLLRIVELLDRFDLPAALAGGLLESVTQDYQDAVQTAFHGDWLRLVRFAQGFTDERMTDHVSALTAVGALVPHTP